MEVFWTAAVGIAGITAAFFAPTWSSRRIEQRREQRDFRRARRLVANELALAVEGLSFVLEGARIPLTDHLSDPIFLPTAAWKSERTVLATLLDEFDWLALSRAYELFARIRGSLFEEAGLLEEGLRPQDLDDRTRANVETAVEIVSAALEKLLVATPLKN
jgi:hypothetical protein